MPYVISMAWVPEEPEKDYLPAVCRLPDGTAISLQMFKAVGERGIWQAIHMITESASKKYKMMESDGRFQEQVCSMGGKFMTRNSDDK